MGSRPTTCKDTSQNTRVLSFENWAVSIYAKWNSLRRDRAGPTPLKRAQPLPPVPTYPGLLRARTKDEKNPFTPPLSKLRSPAGAESARKRSLRSLSENFCKHAGFPSPKGSASEDTCRFNNVVDHCGLCARQLPRTCSGWPLVPKPQYGGLLAFLMSRDELPFRGSFHGPKLSCVICVASDFDILQHPIVADVPQERPEDRSLWNTARPHSYAILSSRTVALYGLKKVHADVPFAFYTSY